MHQSALRNDLITQKWIAHIQLPTREKEKKKKEKKKGERERERDTMPLKIIT